MKIRLLGEKVISYSNISGLLSCIIQLQLVTISTFYLLTIPFVKDHSRLAYFVVKEANHNRTSGIR